MKANFTKSEQITDGLRRSFKNSYYKMANRICFGYAIMNDGELCINEAEAKIVRWIFNSYFAGDNFGKIATSLEHMGIVSPSGKMKWNREAISKLLSNEKYTDSVLLQKTTSFCKMQFANDGEAEKVLITNHHDAIISSEQFEQVQQMKNARSRSQVQDFCMKMSF